MHAELARAFGRIGILSFGGPAAQIALLHRVVVEEKRWLTEAEYLRALSFCMLLPGPEAMQLATYAGWRVGGLRGGLIAGGLFVLPGAVIMAALAAAYVAWGHLALAEGVFLGIKAAVVVIVIEALLRVARRALKQPLHQVLAVLSFAAIFALGLPFPAVVAAAALAGALWLPRKVAPEGAAPPGLGRGLRMIAVGTAVWLAPIAALALAGQDFLVDIGLYFARLAVVTFGGAYAVLADMVLNVPWVTPAQMMDALGLAETTPGPLILVTEFVAWLAGAAQGGTPMALAAALLSLWALFLPSFLLIFAFAPLVDWLTTRPSLGTALEGVMAAVVGVIGSLAATFALHLFFPAAMGDGPAALPLPDWSSLDLRALGLALAAGVALLRLHWPLTVVLGLCAAAGLAL